MAEDANLPLRAATDEVLQAYFSLVPADTRRMTPVD